jgi:hypothetical protein
LGTARLAAGVKEVVLEMSTATTVAQLVPEIAARCPSLVGSVLDLERRALSPGHVLCRNGRDILVGPQATVQPGDRLILMSSLGGG